MKNHGNIKTSDTLKGIAITAVLINHYLNLNVSGDCEGFASIWISIFFILSGYGLFHSLDRQFNEHLGDIFSTKILKFYYQRVIRIFPLLWCAWPIQLMAVQSDIMVMKSDIILVHSDNLSILTPLGIHGTGHYWFIPALIQCYFLAPFIYLGTKRKPALLLIILICGLFLLNIFIFSHQAPEIIKKILQFANTQWRGVYFLHIILFFFGISIAKHLNYRNIVNRERHNRKNIFYNYFFWFYVLSTIILMVILKRYSANNHFVEIAFTALPLLLIASLCIFSLFYNVENKYFCFLGNISYPIYLFHMTYYLALSKIGEFPVDSIHELVWFIGTLPFFIIFCNYIGLMDKKMANKLKSIYIYYNAQQGATLARDSAELHPRQ